MKRILFAALILIFAAGAHAKTPRQDEIMQAMKDEITRSQSQLKLDKMARPYFIAYKVKTFERIYISAQRGRLTSARRSEYIYPKVSLRAGNSKEDSSFFDSYIYPSYQGASPTSGYNGLRAALWDATNHAYNNALAQLAKKQAYKKNRNITNEMAAFSAAKPAGDLQQITPPAFDETYWKEAAEQTSAEGQIKELDNFKSDISLSFEPVYFLNSEGAAYTRQNIFIVITFNAAAKTKDGFELNETRQYVYTDLKEVPPLQELKQKALNLAQETAALTKSPKAEAFIGPVMLEGPAAAAFLEEVFYPAAINVRPVYSDTADPAFGEFSQKLGLKVMPADFDVYNNPLQTSFDGVRLAGAAAVDDEGAAAQNIQLVKAGILTLLPATRSLIKGQKATNGHAYLNLFGNNLFASADLNNLFFIPQNPVAKEQFKQKFMEYCKEEGLSYCYIVRSNPLAPQVSAYKMDAQTGAETPVHGLTFTDIKNTRALRFIKYAADDLKPYNRPYGFSLVAPSLILTEAEARPSKRAPVRAPLVPRP
ncbi:MAG: hypothetical protein LBR90_01315 [Elusimicrobiota bacterium]|jgi:hypothetical protein|nr:hypothetical protein [Elusimicrobiota bacterium]